jgi:hypothetical protein
MNKKFTKSITLAVAALSLVSACSYLGLKKDANKCAANKCSSKKDEAHKCGAANGCAAKADVVKTKAAAKTKTNNEK